MPEYCPKRRDWRALEEDACIECTSRQGLSCGYYLGQYGRYGEVINLSDILTEKEMTLLIESKLKEQPKVVVEHIYRYINVYPDKKKGYKYE